MKKQLRSRRIFGVALGCAIVLYAVVATVVFLSEDRNARLVDCLIACATGSGAARADDPSVTYSLGSAGVVELTGEVTLDAAGIRAVPAGDVNGDGYDDFLIASKTNDATGVNAGAAYLVFGRSTPLTSEGLGGVGNVVVKFTGEAASDYGGTAASAAGDVNGDGFDDILIGSYQPNPPSAGPGAAYLVYGKAEPFASTIGLGDASIVKFSGEAANDKAAAMIGPAGDVNNDGFDDFLIGATSNDAGGTDAGAAYLVYGQAAALTSANLSTMVRFAGEANFDAAGSGLGFGDFNNDGYSDILISSPTYAADNVGRTYLFYGQAAALTSASLSTGIQFAGEAANDTSGGFVDSAGDINNDGYDDILIGAAANDDAGANAGSVYLIYGQAAALASAGLSAAVEFTGEAAGDNAGTIATTVGDLNADGYDDFLVGSPLNDDGGADAGAAYLVYGKAAAFVSTSLSNAAIEFTGEVAGDRSGMSGGGNLDVNGDGLLDVLVGSRLSDDAAVDAGATYVVYSQPPFVSLSAAEQTLAESAVTGTVTANVSAAFSRDIAVPFVVSGTATGGGADHTLATGSITILSGALSGSVDFDLIDDLIDENDETIVVTLGRPGYGTLAAPTVQTITVTDNDTAGITVGAISGNTTEAGGSATYTVVLDTQPTADVTVGVASTDGTEGSVDPSTLTFTALDWDDAVAHTVTVTGVNDFSIDGDVEYGITNAPAASADPKYDGINPADIPSIFNADNDVAGFVVGAISGNTTEAGGTATATIVLTSQPTDDVTVSVESSDTGEGTVEPASLTFTGANWDDPDAHTVTVTGADDFVDDGDIGYSIRTSVAVSDDPDYSGRAVADVAATNVDDDGFGITVSAISGNTTEAGGTATATIVLDSEPTADVTVGLSSSDATEGTVSPASFSFTAGNWNVPQELTVTGVDDPVDDGDVGYSIVTAAAVSGDPNYGGLDPANVAGIANSDNDASGLDVSAVLGGTTEAGGMATATVVLTSEPGGDVVVSLASSDATEGTVFPASLSFTAGNWNVPQELTVTGVDDLVDDGDVAYSVVTGTASSTDLLYDGLNPADVVGITNADNDAAGVVVTVSDGGTAVREGSTTDTYAVVLLSEPTSDVVISIASTLNQAVPDDLSLVFTAGNWAISQTVTVSAVDDESFEYVSSDILEHSVVSLDPVYDGFAVDSVVVVVSDNDGSGTTAQDPSFVAAKTIHVVSPDSGANVLPGSTIFAVWEYTGLVPFVTVSLSTDSGETWTEVQKNIPNDGSTSFAAPSVTTSHAAIKVEGTDLAAVLASDVSSEFSISAPVPESDAEETLPVADAPTPAEIAEAELADRLANLPSTVSIDMLVHDTTPGVYLVGADGYRHAFPNESVFYSWYPSFDAVVHIPISDLAQIPLGQNVTYRPGSWLVKFELSPRIYVVDRFATLRWVTSEVVAEALYGPDWKEWIVTIPDTVLRNYTFGAYVYVASDFNPLSFSSILTPNDSMAAAE